MDSLAAGRGDPGRKGVFGHDARWFPWRLSSGLERHPLRLPVKRVCQRRRGRVESKNIGCNVVWLNRKLRILTAGVAPMTELDVDFPVVLSGFQRIAREHAQNGPGLDVSNFADDKRVRAISETAR